MKVLKVVTMGILALQLASIPADAMQNAELSNGLVETQDEQLKTKLARSPIGDNVHTEVYTFITDALLKEKSYSSEQVSAMIDQERQNLENHSTDKPFVAEIYEGEIPSLLGMLCRDFPGCQEITLYQKDGVGIAAGKLATKLEFKEKRDPVLNMGFLGLNPAEALGVKTHTGTDGGTYHEVIKAIYYDKDRNNSYMSTDSLPKDHQLIGYVRYIVG